MKNYKLLQLLESILGKSKPTARGNYSFFSPFINHHKPKLEVRSSPDENGNYTWHCWVSENRGKSIHSLLKKLNQPKEVFNELSKILDIPTYQSTIVDTTTEVIKLPDEYKPLWRVDHSIEYKAAMHYLKSRGLSIFDIIRYRIGYATEGKYKNRVIIPSYDENAKLNYFTSRLYRNKEKVLTYLNPQISRDIIGFELLINWKQPIILCESAFDAIAIKRNAIPLFGKNIQSKLKRKIIEERVKDIYICLDPDALKQSLEIASAFMGEGLNVYFVELVTGDPSELGFELMNSLITNTSKMTTESLMRKQIGLAWK